MKKVIFCMILFVLKTAETIRVLAIQGSCAIPDNVQNLNMKKMLGSWYVIKHTNYDARDYCSVLKFKQEHNQYTIEQCYHPKDPDDKCYKFANLTISADQISAQVNPIWLYMKSTNNFNVHVVITDYDTYAGIHICEDGRNYGRNYAIKSIVILSRKAILDQQCIDKVTSKFHQFGITDQLYTYDQDECPIEQNILATTCATESNTISLDIYLISLLIIMILK